MSDFHIGDFVEFSTGNGTTHGFIEGYMVPVTGPISYKIMDITGRIYYDVKEARITYPTKERTFPDYKNYNEISCVGIRKNTKSRAWETYRNGGMDKMIDKDWADIIARDWKISQDLYKREYMGQIDKYNYSIGTKVRIKSKDGREWIGEVCDYKVTYQGTLYQIRNDVGQMYSIYDKQILGILNNDRAVIKEYGQFAYKKVIFSDPCTIVIWKDGTKTIARTAEDDTFNPEAGLAICFMKKALGDQVAKKVLRKEVPNIEPMTFQDVVDYFNKFSFYENDKSETKESELFYDDTKETVKEDGDD